MQPLSNELLDILASRFQAAAQGYRARCEIDWVLPADDSSPSVEPSFVQYKEMEGVGVAGPQYTYRTTLDAPSTAGNLLVLLATDSGLNAGTFWEAPAGWNTVLLNDNVNPPSSGFYIQAFWKESEGEQNVDCHLTGVLRGPRVMLLEYEGLTNPTLYSVTAEVREQLGFANTPDIPYPAGAALVSCLIFMDDGPQSGDELTVGGTGITLRTPQDSSLPGYLGSTGCLAVADAFRGPGDSPGTFTDWQFFFTGTGRTVTIGLVFVGAAEEPTLITTHLRPKSVAIDKSRRMAASQVTLEFENEAGLIGVSPSSFTQPHARVRVWQWYGDAADEVRTFTGLMDPIHESRDPRTVTITARDMMKRLIVQTFSASAPQLAGETGAVRTAANGVYLEMEVSDIVSDILDRAGWPTADREITPTSYVLDEYVLADGVSWAEAIVDDNGPTGLTGYEAGADELGIFYFRPGLASKAVDSDTDPTPDYAYVVADPDTDNLTSRNVIHLDHELDDYDLRTRVKVRGNLAIAKPAWTELWHTNSFSKPVGIWYDPATPNYIYVLDRGTKKIYRYKTTGTAAQRGRDPGGIWPLDISGDVAHPLGLSGDPADSTVFWVLGAAWRDSSGANLNASIHKFRKSDGVELDSDSIADGRWTDLKATSTALWLTNLDTDKVHKFSKTTLAQVASYTTVGPGGADQDDPTGVFADDTTLGLFFLGHARFLLVDQSDPTTIDTTNALGIAAGVISTAGTKIIGGEIDTDTDAHLYACSDDLGLLWKFALTEPSTTEIAVEVVDTELEDELGFLSGAEDREHDTHTGDADHPFEVRRETLTLQKTISNLAQAMETAQRRLADLAHRRETLDLGIVGHPGLQRGDLIPVTDPITGIDELWVLDTYRDNMDPDRGYLGTVALLPYEPSY